MNLTLGMNIGRMASKNLASRIKTEDKSWKMTNEGLSNSTHSGRFS